MATTESAQQTATPFGLGFEQIADLGEHVTTAARRAGTLYLDAYEKAAERAIDAETKLADLTPQQWLESLIRTHAEIARECVDTYTKTARSLLK